MPKDVVSELIRENAELNARNAELARALAQVEAVSQLTVGVVHDLRNAFSVMMMAAHGLRLKAGDPSQRELAGTVLTAGTHASELARDLLNFARKEDARTSRVDLPQFFTEFERLVDRISLKRIACAVEIAPDVSPIQVDRQQLSAALLNLSVNARDAMPHGGALHISARNLAGTTTAAPELPAGEFVEIAVADTGSGMDRATLARATEAFFTTKGESGGTGLGLAMVQSFATRSGGALSIESELGRGTRVRLFLPCVPRRAAHPGDARIERMEGRIRTDWLRRALQEWRAACPANGLPRPVAAEAGLLEHADQSLVLAVERTATPPALRVVRMGEALSNALGRSELGDVPLRGPLVLGGLGAAYRRALRSRAPSYEYARYALGDGSPGEFERLILPAAADGETVSHLIGVVQLPYAVSAGGSESWRNSIEGH